MLASFLAKPGQDKLKNREKKKKGFCSRYRFYLIRAGAFPKKIVKKMQKLKNIILASFLAKLD